MRKMRPFHIAEGQIAFCGARVSVSQRRHVQELLSAARRDYFGTAAEFRMYGCRECAGRAADWVLAALNLPWLDSPAAGGPPEKDRDDEHLSNGTSARTH